ncbi:hypothetical protein HYU19_05995 [Candidatus Woesearchaeota archaeon]|nr:hypothetical protein [Candidatus Woesearchaeota archaeon]
MGAKSTWGWKREHHQFSRAGWLLFILTLLAGAPVTALQNSPQALQDVLLALFAGLVIFLLLLIIAIVIAALAKRRKVRIKEWSFYEPILGDPETTPLPSVAARAAAKKKKTSAKAAARASSPAYSSPFSTTASTPYSIVSDKLPDDKGQENRVGEAPKKRWAWIALIIVIALLIAAGVGAWYVLASLSSSSLPAAPPAALAPAPSPLPAADTNASSSTGLLLWLSLAAGILVLAILLVIILLLRQQKHRTPTTEAWWESEQEKPGEEAAQPTVVSSSKEKKAAKAGAAGKTDAFFKDIERIAEEQEKLARQQHELIKPYHRKASKAKKIFLWLLLILALAGILGGGLAWYFLAVPQYSIDNTILRVDASGLSTRGDAVLIPKGKDVRLPLTFTNTKEERITADLDFGLDWLQASRTSLTIEPGQASFIDIVVKPSLADPGLYRLKVNMKDSSGTTEQEILLQIVRERGQGTGQEKTAPSTTPGTTAGRTTTGTSAAAPLIPGWLAGKGYLLWWIGGGLIVLAILIILIVEFYRRRKKKKKYVMLAEGQEPSYVGSLPGKKQPRQNDKTEMTTEMTVGEAKPRQGWKNIGKILLTVVISLLILGALIGGAYYALTVYGGKQGNGQQQAPVELLPAQEQAKEPVKVPLGLTIIPVKITNRQDNVTYKISLKDTIGWIKPQESSVDIPPHSQRTVNLMVEPTREVADGIYRVTIDLGVTGGDTEGDKDVSSSLLIEVDKYAFVDEAAPYIIYAAIGLVVLLFIIFYHHQTTRSLEFRPIFKQVNTKENARKAIEKGKLGRTRLKVR